MDNAIIIALISGLAVAIPSVFTTLTSNRKNNELITYRIDELSKRVEKHNSVVERVYKLESDVRTAFIKIDEVKEERR